ncbi:MAG: hypothetical protein ACRDDZ_07645 [Marinifilaceae bacterium]
MYLITRWGTESVVTCNLSEAVKVDIPSLDTIDSCPFSLEMKKELLSVDVLASCGCRIYISLGDTRVVPSSIGVIGHVGCA